MREARILLITRTDIESQSIAHYLNALNQASGNISFASIRPEGLTIHKGICQEATIALIHAPSASEGEQNEFLNYSLNQLKAASFGGRILLVGFAQRLMSKFKEPAAIESSPADLYGAVQRTMNDDQTKARASHRLAINEKAWAERDESRQLFTTWVKNVSRDGAAIQFKGDQALTIGEILSLEFFPGVGKPAVNLKCKVVWIERTGRDENSLAQAGLYFLRGA